MDADADGRSVARWSKERGRENEVEVREGGRERVRTICTVNTTLSACAQLSVAMRLSSGSSVRMYAVESRILEMICLGRQAGNEIVSHLVVLPLRRLKSRGRGSRGKDMTHLIRVRHGYLLS